jgi:hypothetical protein
VSRLHTLMNCCKVLYIRVPIGSMNALPGDKSLKVNNSCSRPILR